MSACRILHIYKAFDQRRYINAIRATVRCGAPVPEEQTTAGEKKEEIFLHVRLCVRGKHLMETVSTFNLRE